MVLFFFLGFNPYRFLDNKVEVFEHLLEKNLCFFFFGSKIYVSSAELVEFLYDVYVIFMFFFFTWDLQGCR